PGNDPALVFDAGKYDRQGERLSGASFSSGARHELGGGAGTEWRRRPGGERGRVAVIDRKHACKVTSPGSDSNPRNPFGVVGARRLFIPSYGTRLPDDVVINEDLATALFFHEQPAHKHGQRGDIALAFSDEHQTFHAACCAFDTSSSLARSTIN